MSDAPQKSDSVESLDEIEKNISYINKIVVDLQDYSRRITPELKIVDLYELIVNSFRTIEIPQNINPRIEIDTQIYLKTDTTLFIRILTKLVINAIQAMPDGGELSITASKAQDTISLSLTYTGVGIPEAVKQKNLHFDHNNKIQMTRTGLSCG